MAIAETSCGKVRGTEVADGVIAWRGIPYAAAPVGPLRLRPPQGHPGWTGARDAAGYGNRSLQPGQGLLLPGPPPDPADEDCLYLNVTAPAGPPPGGAPGRPVLAWIHGGGYESGSGSDAPGGGARFARDHDVVVVTFNYRLGALGFLDVPGEHPTGALGLHDQVAALAWVQRNIAGFGGDPARVTVFGVSAGAKSVTALLASPLARGLFWRAASCSGGDHVQSADQAGRLSAAFFAALGARPEQVRDVPAGDILAAQLAVAAPPRSTWAWRPSVDGAVLTAQPLAAVAAGSAAGIGLLAQTCARECALFELTSPGTAAQAGRVLESYFGPQRSAELLAAYAAASPQATERELRVAVMTDERYVTRAGRLADAQSAHASVWRSVYSGPFGGLPEIISASYAAHGADTEAIWLGGPGLAGELHAAFGAFAAGASPGWPQYAVPQRLTKVFEPGGSFVAADPLEHARTAWEGLDWQPGTWSDLGGNL